MHWEVQIVGETADLNMLVEAFADQTVRIVKRDNEYLLRAESFEKLDSRAVTEEAKKIVSMLSGLARLDLGLYTSLKIGTVYRIKDDGGRDIFILPEPVAIRCRVFPATITITKTDGSKDIHYPANTIEKRLAFARTDETVAKVLRLRNSDNLDWVDLYRIYEVVEGDIGLATIVEKGWCTKKAIERFTRTANSVAVAGDQARHGKERTQPPKNPVTISEARMLVDDILRGWLDNKHRSVS